MLIYLKIFIFKKDFFFSKKAFLTQLVEFRFCKPKVIGSNPVGGYKKPNNNNVVLDLVYFKNIKKEI